jgi:hypothetical protein
LRISAVRMRSVILLLGRTRSYGMVVRMVLQAGRAERARTSRVTLLAQVHAYSAARSAADGN